MLLVRCSILMSQQYIKKGVFKQTHIKQGFVLIDENVTRGLQEPNSVCLLTAVIQYLLNRCFH